ncbi:MAG: glycosyltransferase family 39 protein [Chitinophagales bacterium]|nr:glycosyltransferase family 39 protein [Chitinophagales bacterium]HRN93164.1 glycosyltransferase family 39 protein [Chitinophagales bacterium]HRP38347.1 glycosyltransferase family 39 protein [Chitinophagales bacterium]
MAKDSKQKLKPEFWLERYRYRIVFVFSFLLYANSIFNYYALDDNLVATTNSQQPHRLTSKGIPAIPEIFTEPYYKDAQGYAFDYRPIALATFAIEHSLFGDNPHVSHFFNVLLYALLCVLLLKTLEALLRNYNPLLAFVCTLLFVAHPVHTEVVASIKNRDEILALLFMLLACLAYFKTEERATNIWLYYLLFVVVFILSILSKPTAIVMLPIVILFVTVHHKPKLLPLLLLSVLPLIVFAVTQSSPIPLSWFLMLLVAVWLLTLLFYTICYVSFLTIKQSVNGHISRALLTVRSIQVISRDNNFFFELSLIPALISIAALVVVSIVLVTKNVSYGYVPVYFTIPILLGILHHKYASPIMFLGILFLSVFSIYVDLLGIALYLLFFTVLISRNKRSFDFWLVTCFALTILFKYFFDNTYLETLVIGLVLYLTLVTRNKYVQYACISLFFMLPTLDFYFSHIKKGEGDIEFRIFELVLSYCAGFLVLAWTKKNPQKWILGISCVLIIVLAFTGKEKLNINLPNSNVKVQISQGLNKKLPQVVEQNVVDRPITYLEAVTDALSPIEYKLGTAAQVLKQYASLLVVPYPLSFYYGYKIIDHQSGFEPLNILVLAVYFLFGITGLLFLRKQKIIAISILVMAIGISIYTNVFLAAPGMMADRFLFVPSLGFCLLLAYAILKLYKQNMENNSVALNWQTIAPKLKYSALAILLVYSGLTIARNSDWKNSLTLFSADIGHLENSAQANNLYALELMAQSFNVDSNTARQMRLTAEYHFKKSVEIYPKYFNTQYDLARTQSILGKSAEAEMNFVKAAEMNPEFPSAWLQAIDMAISQQRYTNAIQYFSFIPQNSINQNPAAILKLGYAYFLNKQYDSSIATLRSGAILFPQQPDLSWAMGEVFMTLSKKDSAIFYYEKSLAINPANTQLRQLILNLRENKIK